MASISTSSPSEDCTSGTDLNNIPTEEERQINTTSWTIAKCKKLQHMVEFHERVPMSFWRESIHTCHNEK